MKNTPLSVAVRASMKPLQDAFEKFADQLPLLNRKIAADHFKVAGIVEKPLQEMITRSNRSRDDYRIFMHHRDFSKLRRVCGVKIVRSKRVPRGQLFVGLNSLDMLWNNKDQQERHSL